MHFWGRSREKLKKSREHPPNREKHPVGPLGGFRERFLIHAAKIGKKPALFDGESQLEDYEKVRED